MNNESKMQQYLTASEVSKDDESNRTAVWPRDIDGVVQEERREIGKTSTEPRKQDKQTTMDGGTTHRKQWWKDQHGDNGISDKV